MATYQGVSIVDYLNSIGQNSTIAARANLAVQNGLVNSAQEYVNLAKQGLNGTINTKLLNILRTQGNQPAPSPSPAPAVPVGGSKTPAQTGAGASPIVNPAQGQVDLTNGGSPTYYHNDGIGIYRFTDADHTTLYLVDGVNHTIQPFQSESAVANYAPLGGMNAAQLEGGNYIHEDSLQNLINAGYKYGGSQTAITNAGYDPLANKKQTANDYLYGKGNISANVAQQSLQILEGYINTWQNAGAISSQTANSILNNPEALSMYLGAMVNGGYTPLDVYKDAKRQDLAAAGDTQMANTTVISPLLTRDQLAGTSGGQLAGSNPKLTPPAQLGGLDSAVMNLPISQTPQSAFNTLVQPVDFNSPAMQDEINNIKSLIYDNTQKQLNATTQQAHDQAIAEWQRTKAIIERNTQMRLSNNAFDAYAQVDGLNKQAGAAGIEGSGIADEARDRYLASIRRSDDLVRQNATDTKEQLRIQTLLNSGSPQDIANGLTAEEKQKYGLIPSAEDQAYYTIDNLRKLYPAPAGVPQAQWDKQLQATINSVIDTSTGSPVYRSKLYSQLAQNTSILNQGATSYQNYIPAIEAGKLPSYQTQKQLTVEAKNLNDTNKAELPFTSVATSQHPFDTPNPGDPTMPPEAAAKAADAAKNINTSPTTSQAPSSTPISSSSSSTPPATTPPSTPAQPKSGYNGVSIVDYLGSVGKANSFADRSKLAASNGISGYTGTASQNTQLLKTLRGY